ncbi:effector-associated domain EAD1-containing protein [Iningainema tapete]|uniref:Effector-associated domain-containing protein n=1 Tax=Iningainema tapete BLCC-T55 TaxID=2748662 RepID=A0A8J6XR38_9CYAN|nr:effector-associated domain EAD1-containing protein [Iningainema tapete]MBD2775896.1 hypothetical protein [Iningainema tapete BLCC-T55]
MRLTGDQRKKLLEAITNAYPNRDDLEIMVSLQLEENLNAIAGGANLTQLVFKLILAVNNPVMGCDRNFMGSINHRKIYR